MRIHILFCLFSQFLGVALAKRNKTSTQNAQIFEAIIVTFHFLVLVYPKWVRSVRLKFDEPSKYWIFRCVPHSTIVIYFAVESLQHFNKILLTLGKCLKWQIMNFIKISKAIRIIIELGIERGRQI